MRARRRILGETAPGARRTRRDVVAPRFDAAASLEGADRPRRERERERAVAALDLLDRPAWMGAREAERESGKLSAFERERLEKIRKNREKLRGAVTAARKKRRRRPSRARRGRLRRWRRRTTASIGGGNASRQRRRRRSDETRPSRGGGGVADRGCAAETAAADARGIAAARAMVQKLAERAAAATRRLTRLRRHFRDVGRESRGVKGAMK